jgi:aspartate ammonia-lyase
MQPGSSIMPGKVNPVIPELVNQVCYPVMGYDAVVSMAADIEKRLHNPGIPVHQRD